MAIHNIEHYIWNEDTSVWDKVHPQTNAGQVSETSSRVFVNPTLINQANGLVRLNGSAKIPDDLINANFTDYLKRDGSLPMLGNLDMDGTSVVQVHTIDWEQGGTIGNTDGSDFTIYYNGAFEYIFNSTGLDMDNKAIANVTSISGPDGGNISFDDNGNLLLPRPGVGDMILGTRLVNSAGYFELDMDSGFITHLATPTQSSDAATKGYVDTIQSQGTHIQAAVRAASTEPVTPLSGVKTIDGVALVAGDRVLLKDQTTASQRGVYIVQTGAWTPLPNDSDKGSLITVLEGTTQKRHQYYSNATNSWILYWVDDDYNVLPNGGLELDPTGLLFGIKSSGVTNAMLAGSIENSKLKLGVDNSSIEFNGNNLRVKASGITNAMLAGSISLSKLVGVIGSDDDYSWSDLQSQDANVQTSIGNHLIRIYNSVRLLRGTNSYNTNNTETIANKSTTRFGSADPSVGFGQSPKNGDVYLKIL